MNSFYIDQWASKIRSFILSDDLCQIKHYLVHRSIQQKKQIVNHKILGSSSLHLACELQRYHIIRYLVKECAAGVNLPSDKGKSPIYICCSHGDVASVEYLYKYGGNIYSLNSNFKNLVMLFVHNANLCSFLLSKGISVHEEDVDRKTAFDYALSTSSLRSMELLIQSGFDVNTPNASGHYPLYEACDRGNVDALEILIHNGANVHEKDKDGKTYLMRFITKFDICQVLIKNEIDINAMDNDGLTAMHHIVEKEADFGIIELLVNCGGNIDAKNNKGMSAAAFAVDKKRQEILEFLLKCGADVNSVDINGSSLLHQAVEVDHLESVKSLVLNGAGVNTCDRDGRNCVQKAAVLNRSLLVEFLLQSSEFKNRLKIDAYELMAANELESLNFNEANSLLTSALNWRKSRNITLKERTMLNSIFQEETEPQTMVELLNVEKDEETMLIQAALIRGRILGPLDRSILNILDKLIDEHMVGDDLMELHVRKHAYSVALKSFGATDNKSIKYKRSTVYCLYHTDPDERSIDFIFDIFSDFTKHIREVLSYESLELTETLAWLFHAWICVIYLLLVENTNEQEETRIIKEIQQIIQIYPGCIKERFLDSLLDEILEEEESLGMELVPRVFLLLLHVLLAQKVVASSIDEDGSTPLHKYLRCLQLGEFSPTLENDTVINKTIELLLENGNHMCIEDKRRKTIFDLLMKRSYPVCLVRDRTLQCLAAEVVVNSKMCVSEVIPHLKQFLNYHKRNQSNLPDSDSDSDSDFGSDSSMLDEFFCFPYPDVF